MHASPRQDGQTPDPAMAFAYLKEAAKDAAHLETSLILSELHAGMQPSKLACLHEAVRAQDNTTFEVQTISLARITYG